MPEFGARQFGQSHFGGRVVTEIEIQASGSSSTKGDARIVRRRTSEASGSLEGVGFGRIVRSPQITASGSSVTDGTGRLARGRTISSSGSMSGAGTGKIVAVCYLFGEGKAVGVGSGELSVIRHTLTREAKRELDKVLPDRIADRPTPTVDLNMEVVTREVASTIPEERNLTKQAIKSRNLGEFDFSRVVEFYFLGRVLNKEEIEEQLEGVEDVKELEIYDTDETIEPEEDERNLEL